MKKANATAAISPKPMPKNACSKFLEVEPVGSEFRVKRLAGRIQSNSMATKRKGARVPPIMPRSTSSTPPAKKIRMIEKIKRFDIS